MQLKNPSGAVIQIFAFLQMNKVWHPTPRRIREVPADFWRPIKPKKHGDGLKPSASPLADIPDVIAHEKTESLHLLAPLADFFTRITRVEMFERNV